MDLEEAKLFMFECFLLPEEGEMLLRLQVVGLAYFDLHITICQWECYEFEFEYDCGLWTTSPLKAKGWWETRRRSMWVHHCDLMTGNTLG